MERASGALIYFFPSFFVILFLEVKKPRKNNS